MSIHLSWESKQILKHLGGKSHPFPDRRPISSGVGTPMYAAYSWLAICKYIEGRGPDFNTASFYLTPEGEQVLNQILAEETNATQSD